MTVVSLTEAAKLADVSRPTLYRYLKNGTLSATKLLDGSRGIDVAELTRVFGDLRRNTPNDTADITLQDTNFLHRENALLREQVTMLKQELSAAHEREYSLLGLLKTKLLTGPSGKRKKGRKKGK